MNNKQELIRKIEVECLLVNSYDIFTMKDIVSRFCLKHKIKVDSPEWFYLAEELWYGLFYISRQFNTFAEFEFELKDGI